MPYYYLWGVQVCADTCMLLNFYRSTLMAPCFIFVVTMVRVYFTSTLLVFVWYWWYYRLLHSTFWNIEKVWFLVCVSFYVPVYLSTQCWSSTSFQNGIDQCFLNLAAWIAFYFVNMSCAAIISWVSMWTYIFLVVWYNLAVRSWISVALGSVV